MLVLTIIWCLWFNRNSIIFKNQCRDYILLIFQIISMLTSWIDSLLLGQDSDTFSHTIQHMQQEWDQTHASQAVYEIASSIDIVSLPIPRSDAPTQVVEAA